MHHLVFSASMALAIVAFPASALAQCELRYASRLGEAALTAQANIKADALRDVADRLETGLGDRPTATVSLDARYTVTAAGGMAQEAYAETVGGFICTLKQRMAGQPEQLERLEVAYRDIVLTLDEYFDPALWQIDALPTRTALRERLRTAAAQPALFSAAEIVAGLPNPTFDTVRLREITATINIPSVIEGTVCAGMLRRSIRRIEPDILASLGNIRATLIKWLSGDRASARLDLWLFASAQMSRQLVRANAPPEQVPVTPNYLVCVRQALEAAAAEEATARAPIPPGTSGGVVPHR